MVLLFTFLSFSDHYPPYTPVFGDIAALIFYSVTRKLSHITLFCETTMKIEIHNIAIGIPALFTGNCCETKISDAHDPLVHLKSRLSAAIKKFLLDKKFGNQFEIEHVEQIDSSRGICLVSNIAISDFDLVHETSKCALQDEFQSFLCTSLKIKNLGNQDFADGMPANSLNEVAAENSGAKGVDDKKMDIPLAFYLRPDDSLPVLPSELIDGECYMFNRFEKSVGVMISSRRTLYIVVQNHQWLDQLADISKVKNSVRLKIAAESDGKISDRKRTLLSYSVFKLIEQPIVKTV